MPPPLPKNEIIVTIQIVVTASEIQMSAEMPEPPTRAEGIHAIRSILAHALNADLGKAEITNITHTNSTSSH